MAKQYRVALYFNMGRVHQQGIVRGIIHYGKMRENWRFYGAFWTLEQVVNFREWNGDGIIAAIESRDDARLLLGSGLPVVDIAEAVSHQRLSVVANDSLATGVAVARHFREMGVKHFAFCGPEKIIWSAKRRRGFAEGLGKRVGSIPTFHRDLSWWRSPGFSPVLARFLKGLPKPLGVLAANDAVGVKVVGACRMANIAVPDEVAVVGVDDEDLLCELSSPTLSSTPFNRLELGIRAAERLDALMRGLIPAMPPLFVPPLPIIRRASSDVSPTSDPLVRAALAAIRDRCHELAGVDEIAGLVFSSRRNLERRFREETGRSLLEALHIARIRMAERVLFETRLPLSKVAARCGFRTPVRFNRIFERYAGITPGRYRELYGTRHPREPGG